MAEDVNNGRKELVDQHLSIIEKHVDNWTNGAFGTHTPAGSLKVADLLIDVVRTEVQAARSELGKLQC